MLAWFGKCLVNGAYVVADLWLLAPKHCEELIHMMFIEFHFIAPEAMVLQLAEVLDSARHATNGVVEGSCSRCCAKGSIKTCPFTVLLLQGSLTIPFHCLDGAGTKEASRWVRADRGCL